MLRAADLNSRLPVKSTIGENGANATKLMRNLSAQAKSWAAALATEEFAFENGPAFPDSQFLFISRTRD